MVHCRQDHSGRIVLVQYETDNSTPSGSLIFIFSFSAECGHPSHLAERFFGVLFGYPLTG